MFKNKCRICLSDENDNVALLFTTDTNNHNSPSETGQLYIDCLQLELTVNDNYPNWICNFCKLQLSVFHNLKAKAKQSFTKFTESERIKIKSEAEYIYNSGTSKVQPTDDQLEDDNLEIWVMNDIDEDGVFELNEKNVTEMKIEVTDDDVYNTNLIVEIPLLKSPLGIKHELGHEDKITNQTIVPDDNLQLYYLCKQCKPYKHLRTKSSFVIHKQIHKDLKHCCYICRKRFRLELNLMKHLAKHNDNKINKFGQRRSRADRLQLNAKANNNQNKHSDHFNCGKCAGKFYRKQDVMSHLLLKHNIKQEDADMMKAWYYI